MNSGQRNEVLRKFESNEPPRLPCSTRSAEVLLVVLIFVSLHIVAAYDWVLSSILKLIGRIHTTRNSQTSFDTTHLSRSVARRMRPIE